MSIKLIEEIDASNLPPELKTLSKNVVMHFKMAGANLEKISFATDYEDQYDEHLVYFRTKQDPHYTNMDPFVFPEIEPSKSEEKTPYFALEFNRGYCYFLVGTEGAAFTISQYGDLILPHSDKTTIIPQFSPIGILLKHIAQFGRLFE